MNRVRIGPRLTFSFAIILLLMFTASGVGLWQFSRLQSAATNLAAVNQNAIVTLRVHNVVLSLRETLEGPAEAQDLELFTAESTRLQTEIATAIEEAIAQLQSTPETSAQFSRQIGDLENTQLALTTQIQTMGNLAQSGDWLAVDLRLHNQLQNTLEMTGGIAASINATVDENYAAASDQMTQAGQLVFTITLVAALFTVGTAAVLAVNVTRSITHPLAELDKAAQAWGAGKFDYTATMPGKDELARLARIFNAGAKQLGRLLNQSEEVIRQRTAELQRRALQLETNIAVGQRIALMINTDDLLTQVAELIRQRYGYYYVGVFIMDEGGQSITVQASAGRELPFPPQLTLRVGEDWEGLIGWVAQHQTAVLVPDVLKDERYTVWNSLPHTRSELSLPLKVGDELIGVLDIQSDRIDAFRADEVNVFQALSDQLAIALRNAMLYRSEQTQRALAETLQQIGNSLTSILDVNEVLNSILGYLDNIVHYDRAAVMLSNGTELQFVAARGYVDEEQPRTLVPIDSTDVDNVFVKIYQTKAPLLIPNVSEYPAWKTVENIRNPGSWLGIPLIREGEVIGMLSLARMEVRPYTANEITLSTAFGAQAAVALENARLYERIKRFSQQMEYEVQNRTQALQEAYTQLEQLDRTKSSFISIASHELRTPITVLKGYSQILLHDPQIRDNEYYTNLVDGIHTGAIRLHAIVDSMLDMAKIDGRTLEIYPEPLALYDLVNKVFRDLQVDMQQRRLSFTITPAVQAMPHIEADQDGLKKVLYHLIVNAVKYTPDGGRITIDGRSWTESPPQPDWPNAGVELMVQDTGIGIDQANQELIFMKFYQTGEVALHSTGRTKFKGGGPGLGLAITQGIVAAHRGRLWVESTGYDEQNLPGSTFHMVLPLQHSAAK